MPEEQALAQLEGNTQIDVQVCYSCGAVHEKLHCQPFKKPNPPWTHWYQCPANGDPVPIAMILYGGNPIEVNNRILRDVAKAQSSGRPLLFATFMVSEKDGDILLDRHTHRFPAARLMEAVDLLRKDLAKESPLPEPKEPLPRANLESIFGPQLAKVNAVEARNGAGTKDDDSEEADPDDEEND